MADKRVLELGAGTGLVGMVASALGKDANLLLEGLGGYIYSVNDLVCPCYKPAPPPSRVVTCIGALIMKCVCHQSWPTLLKMGRYSGITMCWYIGTIA